MKLVFYLLGLNIVFASSQTAEISSDLKRIENRITWLYVQLAKMQTRLNRDMSTCLHNKYNLKYLKDDVNSKHVETMSLLATAVGLLNNMKTSCREDQVIVTDPSQATDSSKRPVTSSSVTTTSRQSTSSTISTTISPTTTSRHYLRADRPSCKSVEHGGNVKDGVYKLDLSGDRQIQVYCSAGYVTLQRRFSGAVSFDRTYAEYERGFGNVYGESWLGLINQHELTTTGSCTLRVVLDVDSTTRSNRKECENTYISDCDGKIKTILADNFRISSASDLYRIQLTFNSTDFAHSWLKELTSEMNGLQFSTKDKGPDSACAQLGAVPAGFWYGSGCSPGLPNTVLTTPDINACSSSNKVCGRWFPYWFTTSWIQFTC